jgi:D-alanyl-D-alanine carboxypeptidase
MKARPGSLFVCAVLFVCIVVLGLCGCSSGTAEDAGPDAAKDSSVSDTTDEPDEAGTGDVANEEGSTGQEVGQEDVTEDVPEVVEVPFPETLAAHLRKAMDEHLAFSGDPGLSVAIRLANGALFVDAAGVADITTSTPMTVDSSFRVGSNTKPYISALVMMLVDEGLVGLDDPLSKYVDGYPAWGNVTIRMLLGMQSGIPDYLVSQAFIVAAVFNPDSLASPDVLLGFVKDEPLLFEPGTDSLYSNTNYILVGLVIEKVTGQPAQEALRTRILEPLGLDATYLDVVDDVKPELAHGYMDLAIVGFLFGLTADDVGLIPESWFLVDQLVDATYLFPPMFSWTDGGLVTTPEDALKFMRALLTGEVISPESLAEMQETTVCPILGFPTDYGLGLITSGGFLGTRWGHGGLNFGYMANTVFFPERDVTFSHMHNFLPEQSYRFEDEVLGLLDSLPADVPGPACAVPEGLFGKEGDDVVEFRFKGPILAEDTESPGSGTAHVRGILDGENVALYGFGTYAEEKKSLTGRRIGLTSLAPSITAGVDLRAATVSIKASLLEGADGGIDPASPYDVAAVVTEIVLAPGTQNVEKMCVVAVQDANRAAHLSACGDTGFGAGVGEVLRLFGAVPVTRDSEAIEAFMTLLGMSVCSCADGKGGFEDCPK